MHRVIVIAAAVAACRAPPDAPEEFEALSAYLFESLGAEDDAALEAGVDNLAGWLLANAEASSEGYTIDLLSQASLDALEVERERDASRLVGGAVTTTGPPTVEQLTAAILLEDQAEIYPDQYESWQRSYRSDAACFVDGSCDEVIVDNDTVTRLPLGLRLASKNTAQYRWVDAGIGRAMLTRSWLREPSRSEPNLLQLEDQLFLAVNVPTEHGLIRLQAVWADAEIVGVDLPEATALNLLVDGMRDQDEVLYAWLAR